MSRCTRTTTPACNRASKRRSGSAAAPGDFGYSVGASFAFRKSKYLRYDESYTYAYQAVKGTALDAYRGYVYLGKFASAEEIASSPEQTFDEKLHGGI